MKNKKLAPIILFVYNRPWHTKQTIEALQKNELASESELFIYSDAPKKEEAEEKVKEVREYINTIIGFNKITIIERKENLGLANSIIDGVTEKISTFGKIIVLEDDLVTSSYFLKFMNDGLNFFKDDKKIWSLSGFNPPIKIPTDYEEEIYLNFRASSWGWATWEDRWNKIDWEVKDFNCFIQNKKEQKRFNRGGEDMTAMLKNQIDGKIDSWAIRWCYSQYKDSSYCIYPVTSKVRNIGNDGSGVHCGKTDKNDVILDNKKTKFSTNLKENKALLKAFKRHFELPFKGKVAKQLKRIGIYKLVKKMIK